eukprot:494719-Alexandrium_andersonii.AAC.1
MEDRRSVTSDRWGSLASGTSATLSKMGSAALAFLAVEGGSEALGHAAGVVGLAACNSAAAWFQTSAIEAEEPTNCFMPSSVLV